MIAIETLKPAVEAAAKEKKIVGSGTRSTPGVSKNRKTSDEPPLHTDVEPISI